MREFPKVRNPLEGVTITRPPKCEPVIWGALPWPRVTGNSGRYGNCRTVTKTQARWRQAGVAIKIHLLPSGTVLNSRQPEVTMSAKPQYIQTTDGPGIGHNSGVVTVSELPWTTDDLINFGQENYHFGSRPTYDRLATTGFGPPFRKAGKLRLYDPPKARACLAARVSPEVTSTSELAKPAANPYRRKEGNILKCPP
jgi:hypothetical protein